MSIAKLRLENAFHYQAWPTSGYPALPHTKRKEIILRLLVFLCSLGSWSCVSQGSSPTLQSSSSKPCPVHHVLLNMASDAKELRSQNITTYIHHLALNHLPWPSSNGESEVASETHEFEMHVFQRARHGCFKDTFSHHINHKVGCRLLCRTGSSLCPDTLRPQEDVNVRNSAQRAQFQRSRLTTDGPAILSLSPEQERERERSSACTSSRLACETSQKKHKVWMFFARTPHPPADRFRRRTEENPSNCVVRPARLTTKMKTL